jgi:hypothetical protein
MLILATERRTDLRPHSNFMPTLRVESEGTVSTHVSCVLISNS